MLSRFKPTTHLRTGEVNSKTTTDWLLNWGTPSSSNLPAKHLTTHIHCSRAAMTLALNGHLLKTVSWQSASKQRPECSWLSATPNFSDLLLNAVGLTEETMPEANVGGQLASRDDASAGMLRGGRGHLVLRGRKRSFALRHRHP